MTLNEEARKPEVVKRIAQLYSTGLKGKAVAKLIRKEFDIEVTEPTITKVYRTFAARRGEVIQADNEMKDMLRGDVLDVKKQLLDVNKKCKEILEEALDPDEKLKAIDRIHAQIMIQTRLLENLNKAPTTEINIVHITTKVLNVVKEWEAQGIIEIKSPSKFKKLKDMYG